MFRIVVGVDGSKESRRALEWALEEAARHKARLEVVSSYDVPASATAYGFGGVLALDELKAQARADAEGRLTDVLAVVDVPDHVTLTHELVEAGQPARALIDRSKDAELLVVGSRGLGGFFGLLLGSVSQQCLHHAACPVVVIR